ncbi:MAG: acetolactate synthase [Jiangellales bacterium]
MSTEQSTPETTEPTVTTDANAELSAHAGTLALAAAQAYGVDALFTLSGAHIFPLYDAAATTKPGMRMVDVRHEQTAVFAAEAAAKLTRRPGFAAVTAGPGVTNAISAVTQAQSSGVPLLVMGGRAPAFRWGTGALQELDHPPLLEPVTKMAATAGDAGAVYPTVAEALRVATMPHRGPTFVDVPMDQLFSHASVVTQPAVEARLAEPDPDAVRAIARLLAHASRPVLVLGSDVWLDGADEAARRFVETTGIPVMPNGMGRGIVAGGHPLLVSKARSAALGGADLVVVAGAPLDFRLGYGIFGNPQSPAPVVHLTDAPSQVATHVPLAGAASGSMARIFTDLLAAWEAEPTHTERQGWSDDLAAGVAATNERDTTLLEAEADGGIHPARVYGALLPLLSDDTVVIADGGDFVSWSGKFIEPARPGGWLDPGPYGCLGAGLGAAIGAGVVRPESPRVLLLGDGAAGFSLAELETLVRHDLPTLVVVGNNGAWGLEKHPMRMLYGYDVLADLRRDTRYDVIAQAMGGDGETVADPSGLSDALARGLASGTTYVVNVLLDPEVAYPRKTTGV